VCIEEDEHLTAGVASAVSFGLRGTLPRSMAVYTNLSKALLDLVDRSIIGRIVADDNLIVEASGCLNARLHRLTERRSLVVRSDDDARTYQSVLLYWR
jgi:hypothetical protein